MSAAGLLVKELQERGVELWFEGDRVRFRAPRGAFGAEDRARLAAQREEVIAALRERAGAEVALRPMSFSQRSLWFLHKQAPGSAAYHVTMSARIEGPVDPVALRHAVQALVDRHAVLRTTYGFDGSAPAQRVAGTAKASLDLNDASALHEASLRERLDADYKRPFDLERGPVFRASLHSRAPDDHVLLLTVHHIAADGWSLLLMTQEFGKLYAEAARGTPAGLAKPEMQYADYVDWQERFLASPEGERLWEYWKRELAALPDPLDLPSGRARPALPNFRGASLEFELEADLGERLGLLARLEGTTLFVVLLATFHALLHRLSGAKDLIVGTPTFGRGRAELIGIVGDFVNSVPIRARLDEATSFRALVAQVRRAVLGALDAQELPLPLLVQRLAPNRDPSRSPLFDTFFVLQRFDQFRELEGLLVGRGDGAAIEFGALRLRPYPLAQQEGQFDLALQMVEHAGRLFGVFKYNPDLFDAATVQRFAADYRSLLEALARDPDTRMADLPGAASSAASVEPVGELLERLRSQDIRVSLDDDRLAVNAPKGALTPALRDELGRRKDEVKVHLRQLGKSGAASRRRDEEPALVHVARAADMPISHMQQGLWFIKQMDPGTCAYNVPGALRLRGPLDVGALERTLADLVDRHESLRTRFLSVDGTPRCAIEPRADIRLERIDMSAVPRAEREQAALREVQAIARRPFDLTRAPLLHAALLYLADDEHILAFVLDHIVADGVSLVIFLAEFQSLYARHVGGSGPPLPELPAQYLDCAERESRWLAGDVLDAHRAFWRRQLAGMPSLLRLPADRPRPPVQTARGARAVARLPAELGRRLKALARTEGATLFMTLLSAFQVLLHRHSGETDIAVGSAIANRNRPEAERVIGFFANNVVLRGDLSGNPTVREVIARTRDVALDAFAHSAMPFDMVVDAVATRRELDHSPLFQVLFVLQSLDAVEFDLPPLKCELLELEAVAARFDLTLDVFDLPQGLRVYFEYNADLFDAATIERLAGHYQRVLEGFVGGPDARIDALPMLADEERARLLLDWNRTAAAYPADATVHGRFEEQAARTPDAVAVRFEDVALAYGELNARANRLARHLRSLGVGRESLVGVCMERSAEMIVALLGILKAGGAYVPLDPAFPKDRIDYMIEDAALQVVVTQESLASLLAPRLQAICVDRDAATLAQWPGENLPALAGAENLAYVIYTSGSTGRPKGVELEHRSVVNFLASMHREPGLTAQDRFVSVTTLSFDIAGLEIHGPLTCGGTVVLASRATALDGQRLAALLERSDATVLQATPATWRVLLESGWQGRAGLKMLCGGEALPRDLADRLLALPGELWNLYGPTETTIWSTLTRVTDASRAIPIGRPIANTQVYVLEPSGLPAPIGVGGELCIGGDGLARGYRNRADLTAEKFVTLDLPGVGPRRVYRTGDVVRFLADGQLEYLGRRDHQVKVRGFRIELGEIEAVLATHPGIRECVVHVREDTPGDQRLVGYLVAAKGAAFDADAARATLRAKLPEYMIPNLFVTLEALPLTPNGKIDRRALPAPQVQAVASGAGVAEAVMTPVQRQVAALWRQVLGVERVGLDVNFFDLGGHSLLLVKLQSALQREFGRELPLVELFQRTTVAAQAERLGASQGAETALKRAQARAAKQHHE